MKWSAITRMHTRMSIAPTMTLARSHRRSDLSTDSSSVLASTLVLLSAATV